MLVFSLVLFPVFSCSSPPFFPFFSFACVCFDNVPALLLFSVFFTSIYGGGFYPAVSFVSSDASRLWISLLDPCYIFMIQRQKKNEQPQVETKIRIIQRLLVYLVYFSSLIFSFSSIFFSIFCSIFFSYLSLSVGSFIPLDASQLRMVYWIQLYVDDTPSEKTRTA